MNNNQPKLIAIVGPTGSGKTDLALDLAERFDGEIICADSRTIYRGMDIGTAKPTAADRARVPHHVLDIVEPDQVYSAREFKLAAQQTVSDIRRRGRLPIVVGGTGLYAYSLLYDYQFPAGARTDERRELEQLPIEELVARLRREDPERAADIDLQNPRRVIRALETIGQPRTQNATLPEGTLLLGLRLSEDVLNTRVAQRTEHMIQIGLVDEVQDLIHKFGVDLEVLRSPGYAETVEYLAGRSSLEDAEELISLHTRQLVKRQLTWFKRNPDIRWVETAEEGMNLAEEFLR